MANQTKPVKTKPEAGDHPETKKHVSAGIADENSSKAISHDGGDARTAQDKDGNEAASPDKARPPAQKRDSK